MARRRLRSFYGVAALDGFGNFGRAEIAAAGALVDYIGLTQQGRAPHLNRRAGWCRVRSCRSTRRPGAISSWSRIQPASASGSLLATIDRTVTAAGARLLADHLAAPLTDPTAIAARLDAVEYFVDAPRLRAALRERLRHCPDIERALTRLSLGRGGPRDLRHCASRWARPRHCARCWPSRVSCRCPSGSPRRRLGLGEHGALVERLRRALADELPLFARDGGFIAAGYSDELDEWRRLRDESRRIIAALQARYAAETAVARIEDPPQQRHRILHRGVGQPCRQARAGIHPSPDDGGGATLHDDGIGRAGDQDRQRRRTGIGPGTAPLRGSRRRGDGQPRRDRRRRGGVGGPRPRGGTWPSARRRATGCGRWWRKEPPSRYHGGRHPMVEAGAGRGRATAAGSSPMTASWRMPGSGSSPVPIWRGRAPFYARTR